MNSTTTPGPADKFTGTANPFGRSAAVLKASRSNVLQAKRFGMTQAAWLAMLLRLVSDTAALRRTSPMHALSLHVISAFSAVNPLPLTP